MTESQIVARGCGIGVGAAREGSDNYLGEDGGPDGLNLLDLGGTEDGLDLVGLNEDSRSVTNFAERLLIPVGSRLLVVFPPEAHFRCSNEASSSIFKPPRIHQFQRNLGYVRRPQYRHRPG